MKRADIEAMKYLGEGWDPNMPGPISDSRYKVYRSEDGTPYAILTKEPKWRSYNTEDWKDLE